MNKQHAMQGVLAALALIIGGAFPVQADSSQTNISAASCIPRYSGAFDGSGADGFRWEISGAFLNQEDDEREQLICAVPFDPLLLRTNGTIPSIEVVVDVIDNSRTDEVRVELYRQNGTASAARVTSTSTSNSQVGKLSLSVSYTPTSVPRFVWIVITVPFKDTPGASGVAGYRVKRA